jgi:hypothetical protein
MSADASVEMVLWILVGENSSNPSRRAPTGGEKIAWSVGTPPPPNRKILLGAGFAKGCLQNPERKRFRG